VQDAMTQPAVSSVVSRRDQITKERNYNLVSYIINIFMEVPVRFGIKWYL